jgi:flagellar capping protein FliD
MVKQFTQMESVLARMQADLNWLSRVQPIPFPTRTTR